LIDWDSSFASPLQFRKKKEKPWNWENWFITLILSLPLSLFYTHTHTHTRTNVHTYIQIEAHTHLQHTHERASTYAHIIKTHAGTQTHVYISHAHTHILTISHALLQITHTHTHTHTHHTHTHSLKTNKHIDDESTCFTTAAAVDYFTFHCLYSIPNILAYKPSFLDSFLTKKRVALRSKSNKFWNLLDFYIKNKEWIEFMITKIWKRWHLKYLKKIILKHCLTLICL